MSESDSDLHHPYLFALVDDGGVAVNLVTGAWSGLNATAAAICRAYEERRSWEAARTLLETRWQVSSRDADAAVKAVRLALDQAPPPPAGESEFPYRLQGQKYVLFHGDEPVLEVDGNVASIRVVAPPERRRLSLANYFRLVSPKVLAAQGHLLLHAAACRFPDGLTAIIGPSGAGKSTTSTLLEDAGLKKEADDMLAVSPQGDRIVAYPGAEERIYLWCDEAAVASEGMPLSGVSTGGLSEALAVPPVPLHRLLFLGSPRSSDGHFTVRKLRPAEALERLMASLFLGGTDPGRLATFLTACQRLSRQVMMELAHAPEGLATLKPALSDYIAKMAS